MIGAHQDRAAEDLHFNVHHRMAFLLRKRLTPGNVAHVHDVTDGVAENFRVEAKLLFGLAHGVYVNAHSAHGGSMEGPWCLVVGRVMACGGIDHGWYAERDEAWRELGLAAPARRALVNAGILRTADLASYTEAEIAALHGMGKKTLVMLRPWMSSPDA